MEDIKVSKQLAYVLRHAPDSVGLTLDEGGWVSVPELLAAFGRRGWHVGEEQLRRVVAENDKRRYVIEGDRIRANQGHSVPVELGLVAVDPPATLYHGTVAANLDSIGSRGLVRGTRHHVHLSADVDTARRVGGRRGRPVVLTVDAGRMAADGQLFYRSTNDVWLTDAVPARYLTIPD